MPLTTTKEMLLRAQGGGYAVAAFNAENMEMMQAIVEAACEVRAPVIIQTTPSTVRYASLDLFYAGVSALARTADVPVALHLDHGSSYELAAAALEAGYSSVMIDGSALDFEENIQLTGRVVKQALKQGVPVEAELGKVGGKEDDLDAKAGNYTDPAQAAEFVSRTGIQTLAVAIGTAHGFYQGEPKLQVRRLAEIRRLVRIPLVLHGASGLREADVCACIKEGICKVNFATELRAAFSDGVKETLARSPAVFDPKVYGAAGRENVKELVKNRMRVCGCDNRVPAPSADGDPI